MDRKKAKQHDWPHRSRSIYWPVSSCQRNLSDCPMASMQYLQKKAFWALWITQISLKCIIRINIDPYYYWVLAYPSLHIQFIRRLESKTKSLQENPNVREKTYRNYDQFRWKQINQHFHHEIHNFHSEFIASLYQIGPVDFSEDTLLGF